MPGRRIAEHVYSCVTQAWLLAFWSKGKEISDREVLVNQIFRPSIISLFAVTEDAIKTTPPIELGKFLSIIRKCSNYLGLFLMQSPTPEQLAEYCAQLQEHIHLQCPNIDADSLNVGQIASKIKAGMIRRRILDPHVEQIEAALLPINTPEAQWRSIAFNSEIPHMVFRALLTGLQTTFREQFSLWQFVQVSRGFRHEEERPSGMPDPEIMTIQTNVADHHDHEGDFRPTGDRIPLGNFCKLAKSVPTGSTCSICVGQVTFQPVADGDESAGPDEKPVVTACGHYFHETCIDAWINDSGMRAANLCPSCRTEMCEGRPRMPASLLEEIEDADMDAEEDRYIMTLELAESINDELPTPPHVPTGQVS